MLFATFAEAVAEGRGKAQADALRRTRTQATAKRLSDPKNRRRFDNVGASDLKVGDIVVVEAGELIPSDGEIIEGVASVNESAITGESAPVIREAGGDRSAVTGGTQVLSDWIVVRVTAAPGQTFIDRMIALVEGARAPEDAERDRARRAARGLDADLRDRRRDDRRPWLHMRGRRCP